MEQIEDKQDDEDRAEAAAWGVAPIPAVRPGGDGSDEEEDEDDEENGDHTLESEGRGFVSARGVTISAT